MVGTGSSIFHPGIDAHGPPGIWRAARFRAIDVSSGRTGRPACGPLLAAFVVVPNGQASLSWFSLVALAAMLVLLQVGRWYRRQSPSRKGIVRGAASRRATRRRHNVVLAVALLIALMFPRSAYTASLANYYTLLPDREFGVSVQTCKSLLFLFPGGRIGALLGGHVGDRFGRREIIWFFDPAPSRSPWSCRSPTCSDWRSDGRGSA